MAWIWVVRAMLILDLVLLLALPFLQGYSGGDAAGVGMAQGFAAIGSMIGLLLVGVLTLIWWRVTVRWAMIVTGGLIAVLTLFLAIGTVFSTLD